MDQIEHGMKFDTPDKTYGLLEASIKNKMQLRILVVQSKAIIGVHK